MTRKARSSQAFIAAMIGIVHWPIVFTLALAPVIAQLYVWLVRREEGQLIEWFGDRCGEYQRRMPIFVPCWQQLDQALTGGGTR